MERFSAAQTQTLTIGLKKAKNNSGHFN